MKKEVIVKLANGWSIRSSSDSHLAGDYVRICDERGHEFLYWDNQEWQEEPIIVIGAILNCAANKLRIIEDADGGPTEVSKKRKAMRASSHTGRAEVKGRHDFGKVVYSRTEHKAPNRQNMPKVSHHWFCDSCGIPYCGKDIDGGRCSSCMSMITDTHAEANGGLENPIDAGEEHYEVRLFAGDTFSCYVDVEPIVESIRAVLIDRKQIDPKLVDGLKICIESNEKVYVMNKAHDVPVLILTASSGGSEQPGDDD